MREKVSAENRLREIRWETRKKDSSEEDAGASPERKKLIETLIDKLRERL